MHKKPATFIKLPEYPGGKEQFRQFVKKHLKYPEKALDHKIEGIVFLSAEINDNGDVSNIRVENGIGYGCDEEAVRILNLIKFGRVKNRGIRVKTRKKFRINFKLPGKPAPSIVYDFKKEDGSNQLKKPEKYSYTVKVNDK